jgi:hypothetical protein
MSCLMRLACMRFWHHSHGHIQTHDQQGTHLCLHLCGGARRRVGHPLPLRVSECVCVKWCACVSISVV